MWFGEPPYQLVLASPVLKAQTTHIRPMRPPTMSKETKPMTMFWKRVKSSDQKTVCNKIKTAQMITADIDITVGINGFRSFSLIATYSVIGTNKCV